MQENNNSVSNADSSPFLKEFHEGIKLISRQGIDTLMGWLDGTDFYKAPASTQFHESYQGGLLEHSVRVYTELASLNAASKLRYEDETIAICGLFHDACKINFYKPGHRNVKDDATGKWNRVPTYNVDDAFPYGHGEKSVYVLERFIRIKPVEAVAIRWHMGGFDSAVKGGDRSLSKAYSDYPLAAMLHIADMKATYLNKSKKEVEQTSFT